MSFFRIAFKPAQPTLAAILIVGSFSPALLGCGGQTEAPPPAEEDLEEIGREHGNAVLNEARPSGNP